MTVAPKDSVFRIQVAVTGERRAWDSSELRYRIGSRKFSQAKLVCIGAIVTDVHAFVRAGQVFWPSVTAGAPDHISSMGPH